eukprot:scaffold189_cov73-Cylindrotheca_fusiformis.AAC.1
MKVLVQSVLADWQGLWFSLILQEHEREDVQQQRRRLPVKKQERCPSDVFSLSPSLHHSCCMRSKERVEKASVEQQKFRMNGQTTVEGQTACQHFGFGIQNGWTDDRRRTDGMSTFWISGWKDRPTVEGQTT